MKTRAISILVATLAACSSPVNSSTPPLEVQLRSRSKSGVVSIQTARWDPRETAFIICDMWNDHWCKGAARRVNELAGPMNHLVAIARDRGVFIIHAPSTCTGFYKDSPARRRAKEAPRSEPPAPLSTSTRWGTAWCWPDPNREPDLPIDDTDMGCDCPTKCVIRDAWTRQISTIVIDPSVDAITDDGQEVVNLLASHGVRHVVLLGVHLNMCVLGRPFGIRQMVHQGRDVALVRDMTDTMYCSKMRPQVSHFAGTDLVVEHVEKYWCPTFTSDEISGGSSFKFKEASP